MDIPLYVLWQVEFRHIHLYHEDEEKEEGGNNF